MSLLDLTQWAIVGPNDFTGFGRQADMLERALSIGRRIVTPSARLEDRSLDPRRDTLLKEDEPIHGVEKILSGLQGIIFFERHSWHPSLLEVAVRLGVKTVCVINWEWFKADRTWNDIDLLVCPSTWTLQTVRAFGYENSCFLHWPVDLSGLPERIISGPGRVFFHNAGLVDVQDRKGTRDVIRAFGRTHRRDLRLIVRMQREVPLPKHDGRVEVLVGNLDNPADLYREGDVAIQPSKMEGIGFMVLEPWCCGIPVITTNYPPMNEYVTDPRLLVKPRWGKRKAFPTQWIPNAHLRLPQAGDLIRRIEWCADHDLASISRSCRSWALQTVSVAATRGAWEEAFARVVADK